MALNIHISKKIIFELAPLNWYLIPGKDTTGSWATYHWLCFFLHVNSPSVKNDWSDEEVVRQMKNLEKEVEATPKKVAGKIVYPKKKR